MPNFKQFKMGDIFQFESVKQSKSQSDIPTDNSEKGIPYIVQSKLNNMFSRNVNRQWLVDHDEKPIPGNKIVLGVTLPALSYQPLEFGASQVILAYSKELNELNGLYLVTVISKQMVQFSYGNKPGLNVYKNMKIPLPVDKKGKIDFDYMEQRIKELECERIKELSNYLSATGLDNYKLSEKDNNILNEKIHFKEINLVSSYIMRGKNVEVDSKGIFNVIPTKKKINANNVSFGGKYPYIARGESRNGMRGKIDFNDVYLNHENTISFGQDTATMYYQSDPYFTGDKIQIFKLNKIYGKLDENLALYLISSMKKSFSMFSWGQSSFALDSIAKIKIKLPFDANDNLNIDYMKNYIKATKKITIKDVVQYKDRVIENTKKVIK